MINTSVDLMTLDVRHWLKSNWPDHPQWMQGKEIPEKAVLQSFIAEFAKPSIKDQLHHHLRALGRTPFLQLNRAIAVACCAANAKSKEIVHIQSKQSVLMIAAVDLGYAEYVFTELLAEVRQRQTFGVPLVRNQHIEFTLAELQAKLFAFEALWELAVENPELPANLELFQSLGLPLIHKLVDEYLQFAGGRGYLKGHGAEFAFRQAVVG